MGMISKLKEGIIKTVLGNEIDSRVKDKFNKILKNPRAMKTQLKEYIQAPSIGRKEDIGWRPLSARETKDYNPLVQSKMQKICYYLYDKNGIAHRLIERIKDFVIGEGLTYESDDKEVLKVIDDFWNDPDNLLEIRQHQKALELSLYGEQFYPTFVNQIDGRVKLGYLDPELVETVLTDPRNAEKRIGIQYRTSASTEILTKILINYDKEEELLMGNCFMFTVNNVSNATRGRSDLFPIADAIDAYEQFLFNRAERADIMNRIIYDLEMKGKTAEEIQEFLREWNLPEANTVFGHNEHTTLTMKVPDMKSQDASNEGEFLFGHIMAGAGFPKHWFARGEGTSRATAVAMDLPTKKQLKTRQRVIKWMFSYMFRYVIHQAVKFGTLKPEQKDTKVRINLPKIEEREIESISRTLVAVTNSLSIGMENKWITEDTARKVYAYIVSNLGHEIDSKEEAEKVKTEESIDPKLKRLYMRKKLADIPEEEKEEEDEV